MSKDSPSISRHQSSLLSAVQTLKGATLISASDEEIHIKFDAKYKRSKFDNFFVKMEYLKDGTWKIFSHSFPHYLPIEAIVGNEKCADPEVNARELHEFVQAFASRKGQVLEAQDRFNDVVTISNSATYDIGKIPASVDVMVPSTVTLNLQSILGSTRENLSHATRKDLKAIKKNFEKYTIAEVINDLAE